MKVTVSRHFGYIKGTSLYRGFLSQATSRQQDRRQLIRIRRLKPAEDALATKLSTLRRSFIPPTFCKLPLSVLHKILVIQGISIRNMKTVVSKRQGIQFREHTKSCEANLMLIHIGEVYVRLNQIRTAVHSM